MQKYINNPYLVNDLKFDLRIYVVISGRLESEMTAFVADEGIARFCTEKYEGASADNFRNDYMHLTNYAINKNSENFEANEDSAEDDVGHKRSVSAVLKIIEEQEKEKGNNDVTMANMWA